MCSMQWDVLSLQWPQEWVTCRRGAPGSSLQRMPESTSADALHALSQVSVRQCTRPMLAIL